MKKIIALVLALLLSAAPLAVFAHSDNANAGTIPKTMTAPVIDGTKDALYDSALKLPIRNGHSATPDGGLGGGGDAWLLWDDEAIYAFIQIDLGGATISPDDYDDRVKDSAQWEITTVEFLADFSNAAEAGDEVIQFRLDDKGYPNVTVCGTGGGFFSGDGCTPYLESGHVRNGDSFYTAELKIKYNTLKTYAESELGANLGAAYGAGKQIGLYLFAQEVAADGTQALFVSVPTDQSGNWVPGGYDYVVLGANEVNVPAAPEPEPEPAVEEAMGGGSEAPEPPVVTAPTAPKTGDSNIMFALLGTLALAACVVTFKKKIKN